MEQCKLCLNYVDRLEDSHFLPKGIYKRLRDKDERNPNPWVISKEKAVQTSKQMTAHILCADCEKRLDKYGENWVFKHCLQENDRFPLASILSSKSPDLTNDANLTKIYYSFKIPKINLPALAYFAASIFWRGSINAWNEDGTIPVRLGPFLEPFRQYLLSSDLKDFPKDSSLIVMVREGKETDRLTLVPSTERIGSNHFYNFSMPGLGFTLIVGKNIPDVYRIMCVVRGYGNPVFVTKVIEKPIIDKTISMLNEIASNRGKILVS